MAIVLPNSFGRYQILKPLGEGGMGAVFLAKDLQLDRLVALKVPKLEEISGTDSYALKRFFQEARSAATLRHPNICPIYDIGEFDGTPYLTMAYIEGQPLASLVAPGKPMDQRQAMQIVRTLARAMEEAHNRGVIHRDLKPSNVMMTDRGEPVIMDFGLARRDETVEVNLTKSGALLGTPAYMAPEQIEGGARTVGHRTEIYTVGVILYQLLTSRLPFEGSVMSMLGQILYHQPEPPSKYRPELDHDLEAICLKAMAKHPKDRFATMAELAIALERKLSEPEVKQRHRGSRWAKALVGTVTVGAVMIAAYVGYQASSRRIVARSGLNQPMKAAMEPASISPTIKQNEPSQPKDVPAPPVTSSTQPSSSTGEPKTQIGKARPAPAIQPVPRESDSPTPATSKQSSRPSLTTTVKPPPPATITTAMLPASTQTEPKPRPSQPAKSLKNKIGMTLVLIPEGSFTMGSSDGEGADDEHPKHERRFSKSFYLSVHEVTQGQYLGVMGKNPSWFSANGGGKEAVEHLSTYQHPVESVTWFEALGYCNQLSQQEGIRPFYTISEAKPQVLDWNGPGYRLPTEAEWEYACRAGSQLRYSFGDDEMELSRHGWFGDLIDRGPHPVGQKLGNPWGLFDMHGNVWEWCWDWYDKDSYKEPAPGEKNGPKEGVRRIRRGGGFSDDTSDLRAAARASLPPGTHSRLVGFRVARNVP